MDYEDLIAFVVGIALGLGFLLWYVWDVKACCGVGV